MIKKILIAALIPLSFLFSKDFSIEALYGFSGLEYSPQKGTINEGGLRVIILTENFANELVGRYSGLSNMNNKEKFEGWEAEYRFGYRMDQEMASLGMLFGSAYMGLGYQNILASSQGVSDYIYIPFGFWGEDATDIDWIKIRYGLNFKTILFVSKGVKKDFKFDFGFGGKVYLGVGFNISDVVDIFAQGFFLYNAPASKFMQYGIEAGLQF